MSAPGGGCLARTSWRNSRLCSNDTPVGTLRRNQPGRDKVEMRRGLAAGIACFNVESEDELDVLNAVALAERKARSRQLAHQSQRRSQNAPVHLDRPQGQQVRHRSRSRAAGGVPPRRVAARASGDRHRLPHRLADHRSTRPIWMRSSACSTWSTASSRTGIRNASHRLRRRPGHRLQRRHATTPRTRCGSNCWPGWTRAASAIAS